MALMTLTRRLRRGAVRPSRTRWQADPSVVVLGEDVGRGGIFGQYQGLQAALRPRARDRHADLRGRDHGRRRRHGAGGLRPVVEMRVVDFALCGMDELVNQAAKNRYMFGGQGRVPLVVRMPSGIWDSSAAQHSQIAREPGSRTCPAWWWCARRRRRTTTRC